MTKKRDEQEAVPVSGARWVWGEKCEEEGLVNCRFKEAGACQTPRHGVKLAEPEIISDDLSGDFEALREEVWRSYDRGDEVRA